MKTRVFTILPIVLAASVSLAAACGPARPTPPPNSWDTYSNRWYGYTIRYPPDSSLVENIGGSSTVVYLLAGDRTFEISQPMVLLVATHLPADCVMPETRDEPESHQTRLRIGNAEFTEVSGQSGTPPTVTTWRSYSTQHEGTCVVITFSLRPSARLPADDSREIAWDNAARNQFDGILASFAWAESK